MATEDRSGVAIMYRPGEVYLGANLFRLLGTPAVPPSVPSSSRLILADAGFPRGGDVRTTIRGPPGDGARTGEGMVRRARFGRMVNDQNQDTRR